MIAKKKINVFKVKKDICRHFVDFFTMV